MDTSSFKKDTLIVGVGGPGLIVAGKIALSNPDIADFAVISYDRQMLCECPIDRKFLMWGKSIDPCGGGGARPFPLKNLVEEYREDLIPLYEGPHSRVIIIAGLGGDSGSAIPLLANEFELNGKEVLAVVSIPFLFEGAKKFKRVMDLVQEFKEKGINTIFVDLQNLVNRHPELDFTNCFPIADQEIINIVLSQFKGNDLIEDEVQPHDGSQPMRLSPESYAEEYGQVQTLCDIIKVLNDKNHYQSMEPLFEDMAKVMARYVRRGTISERTRRTINAGMLNDEDVFSDGVLDVAKLRQNLLYRIKNEEDDQIEEVMAKRDVFKLAGLVQYMNDFRRYTSSDEIRDDLCRFVFDRITSCGDFRMSHLNDKMFYNHPMGGHAYPYFAFIQAIKAMWSQISTDGVLDNSKLQKVMINRYQEDRDKYGLFSLALKHYVQDSSCHPEVYVPKSGEYFGPVLVEDFPFSSRRYIESCGEGKGPNRTDDYYEYQIMKQLIASDPKYVSIGPNNDLIIPKEDFSLPAYGPTGKFHFPFKIAQEEFIKKQLFENNMPVTQSETEERQNRESMIEKARAKIRRMIGRNDDAE